MKKLFLLSVLTMFTVCAFAAQQELVYVVNDEAERYDPGLTSETFAASVIGNTFEGLVRLDKTGQVASAPVKRWVVSKSGLVYTFYIHDNAKWSDGKDLTAQDFEWSWKRVLDKKVAAQNAPMLYDYILNGKEYYDGKVSVDQVGIKSVNKKTLELRLKKSTPYMLQLLTYAVYYPVRKDVVAKDPEGWSRKPALFVGNGPFKIKEINIGKSVVFVKNTHYRNAGNVKLQKLTFRLVPDLGTSLTAMEAGDVDGIREVPAAEIPRLMVESQLFKAIPALGTTYAFFNCSRKPLDNPRVRKALAKAIDRSQIIEHVLQSADVPARAVVLFGMAFNGKDFREEGGFYGLGESAQVKEAQKLLAEAGYPNGKGFPELTYKYYTHPLIKKLIEAIQQMWKKNLNIDIKLATSEWKVYYPEIRKLNFDISQMGWGADYPHPMTFLDNFVSTSPNNYTGWSATAYDDNIAKSKATTRVKESVKYMHKAEDVLMNDMVLLTMYHRGYYMMMADHVKGWWRSSLNVTYFEDAYIE
jgi:oligopeptide transport system substrate-binding protein